MTITENSPNVPPKTVCKPLPRDADRGVEVRDALRQVVFGDQLALHRRVRDLITGLPGRPGSSLTALEKAETAPGLLQAAIRGLGVGASEVSADTQLRGALCDWSQIAAPQLLLILTGHFDLALGAIRHLGNGSPYQERCPSDLEDASALGVLMLTELGGTNGANQQTTATYDPETDGFWITSPRITAVKFMPNVASERMPKTVVVTARLIVGGADEGVLPFLLRLRTATGLAEGVELAALPDTDAPMDHATIRFRRTWVPRDALLGGDWARLDDEGRFECDLPVRRRWHRAIGVLDNGRLDLANAAIASARAALVGLHNYAGQRRPSQTVMIDRDSVQQDLVDGVAATVAVGALGRMIRDMRTKPESADDPSQVLWSMLAKPLLSDTAAAVLTTCRRRAAAQGALKINHFTDWIHNIEAIITAEGENRIMAVTAGRSTAVTTLRLPDTPADLPWYVRMLIERERRLAREVATGVSDPASDALGPESAAVELATATGERLAATALIIESRNAADPQASELIESIAAAYALDRIKCRAPWFLAERKIADVAAELRRYRRVVLDHLPLILDAFEIRGLGGPVFSGDYVGTWQEYTHWHDDTFLAAPV